MVAKGLYLLMERLVKASMSFNRLKKRINRLTLLGITVDIIFVSVLSLPFIGIGVGPKFDLFTYISAFFVIILYLAFFEYVLWKGLDDSTYR